MSRSQQDAFIDDSDETCPLCVEEFDLSDRNFKPCPCGYQICQFCFNNIRTNLNGLCPACRRAYSDETIEYKSVSAEEYKAEQQKKNRLMNERKIREMQKREVEAQNRKHLAGLRVVQKNLVYVTGLNPRIKEEDLLQTLRGAQYFGQYGKIVKIVVNKRTGDPYNGPHDKGGTGMGVYVTFARKEDAASCIQAVDGSKNGDRILRATYGTTKYCSAYLRNEQCPNRNCMFLHEPGEEAESFSRLDVSSINSGQREPPLQQGHSLYAHMQHPPPLHRTGSATPRYSDDHNESGSALPPTVSWASKNPPTPAARSAVPAIQRESALAHTPSPKVTPAAPTRVQEPPRQPAAPPAAVHEEKPVVDKHPVAVSSKASASKPVEASPDASRASVNASPAKPEVVPVEIPQQIAKPATPVAAEKKQPRPPLDLSDIWNAAADPKFQFVFSLNGLSEANAFADILSIPPMFDAQGGKRRRALMEQMRQEHERNKLDEDQTNAYQPTDEHHFQQVQALQAPPQRQETPQQQAPIGTANAAPQLRQFSQQQQQLQHILKSGLSQQQQQQQQQIPHAAFQQQDAITLLQQQNMRAVTPNSLGGSAQLGSGPSQQQFSVFGQSGQPQGSLHTRQSSRYNFINDAATASVGIKATANAQHMAQQQQMMPHNAPQAQQSIPANFFSHNMSAPNVQAPPGLKTSTPPGVNIFNQAGFGNMGLHSSSAKVEAGNDLLQQLMTRRDKVDLPDPSILQARMAPQHPGHQHLQHQSQLQMSAAQSQQGDEDEPVSKTVSPPPGLSGIPLPFSKVLQSHPAESKSEEKLASSAQKLDKKSAVGENTKKDEDSNAFKLAGSTPQIKAVKKRPEPPRVVTNLPLPEKQAVDQKASAVDSPSTATSSPVPSSSYAQVHRQGPLMMRILSNPTAANSPLQGKKNSISGGRPGTPGTEPFSDTASTTSSVRAASPTPISPRRIIMNTQPPRAKTKSALKKERLQAQKEQVKELEHGLAAADGEHAPIMSRATKKKDRQKSTPSASRQVSRPPSPGPAPKVVETKPPAEPAPKPIPEQPPVQVKPEPKPKAEPKQKAEPKPKVEPKIVEKEEPKQEVKPEPKEEPKDAHASHLSVAQLLAELQASGAVNYSELDMLKPVVGMSHRFEFTSDELSKFHPSVFASGKKQNSVDENGKHITGSRVFVSPGGQVLEGLTPEQEEKYVKLEANIAKNSRSPFRWNPTKPIHEHKEPARAQLPPRSLKTNELAQYLEEAKKSLAQYITGRARDGKMAEGHGILFSGKSSTSISVDEALTCINQLTSLADAEGFGAHGTMHINKAGSTVYSRDFSFDDSSLNIDQLRDKLLAAMSLSTKLPKIEELTGALEVAIGLPLPSMPVQDSKGRVEEAEKKYLAAKKEAEQYEKRVMGLTKKNKKLAGL